MNPSDGGEAVAALDISGTWLGNLALSSPIRLVFNFEQSEDSTWRGTVDSPDQGAFGLPMTSVDVTGNRVEVHLADIGLQFSGRGSGDGQTLSGVVKQGGEVIALTMERQSAPLDYRRPQDPVAPFPYNSADVTFASDAPRVTLAGTLTWPQGPGPFPAVVLITGSGPQNRNEELLNHRPFLVLADALTRANVVVLRYDDRGVGESTGVFDGATSQDFAADARGAVNYLRSQSELELSAVGLAGHSEGGLIAPLVADGNSDVAFLVLLAAPAVDGKTILISQSRAIASADGASDAALDAAEAQQRALYACFDDLAATAAELDACLRGVLTSVGVSESAPLLAELERPWMRWFMTYDPVPVLRRTRIPVLALTGSLDLQVLTSVNVPPMRAAFQEAGNDQAVVSELEGLNHLFQHATTGSPAEYGSIAETMAPEVLTQIAEWISDFGDVEP